MLREDDNRSFLEIDLNQLEREWINQPKLFDKWAEKAARARLTKDEAEAALELCRCNLGRKFRNESEKKLSNDAITELVTTHPRYQKALNLVNRTSYRLGVVQAVVTALDHRKKALEKTVDLHGQNYFSTPQAKNGSMKEVERQSIRRRQKNE